MLSIPAIIMTRYKKYLLAIILFTLAAVVIINLLKNPSNDHVWERGQDILPYSTIVGNDITIHNVRNSTHENENTQLSYFDKQFSIEDVISVDYIVEPFASVAAAHTFLSFGLRDGSHISVSVESRREADETFKPLLGLFNTYELIYVIADEKDILTQRVIQRDNQVFVYPTVATEDVAQSLLHNILERVNELQVQPEFYNLVTNSCTTNIIDHINNISTKNIGWDYRIVLPKESDALAYELELLNTDYTLEELRTMYDATEAVKEHLQDPDFSTAIRADWPTNDSNQ